MRARVLLACLLPLLALASATWAQTAPATPAPGPQRIYGIYMNGCIAGASPLPLEGPGYEVVRVSRNRFWGHDRTIHFIQDFGRRIDALKMQHVYIGDISQPRGGRMTSGHASHQVGLDVDIWFQQTKRPHLPAAQRENPVLQSLVLKGEVGIDEKVWLPAHAQLLKIAAGFAEVDRIFVNKLIKQRLCQTETGDRTWLRKIVPWYYHDDHFHVRLYCPPGDPGCQPQAPVPAGDGCGKALDDWMAVPDPDTIVRNSGPPPRPPRLPAACTQVMATH